MYKVVFEGTSNSSWPDSSVGQLIDQFGCGLESHLGQLQLWIQLSTHSTPLMRLMEDFGGCK